MTEKRFKQFGLWIIDDPNSNVNSIADLIDTKLMSTNEVVDLLNKLYEENERLKKDVENLQEVVAELGATLLMNGFEIEINGENLSELVVDDE